MADPFYANDGSELPGGFHPDSDDLVGTGSDTIQYVTNELSRGHSFGTQRLASFNAFKPGTESSDPIVIHDDIIIRDPDQVRDSGDEVVIPRPNGSSEGISTLLTNSTVNFARSSRAQSEPEPGQSRPPCGVGDFPCTGRIASGTNRAGHRGEPDTPRR